MSDERVGPERVAPRYANDPEFRAALDEARETLMADMMTQFAALQAASEPVSSGSDPTGVLSGLALQLAELTGQGQGRTYVDPKILEQRRKAYVELEALLLDLYAKSNKGRNKEFVPAYRLTAKVHLNFGRDICEALVEPLYRDRTNLIQPTEIDFPLIPNFAMQPINEPAKAVHDLFIAWTGNVSAAREPDALMALTAQGAVVRGKAASVLLRGGQRTIGAGERIPNDPGNRDDDGDEPIAAIRRNVQPVTTRVQVLGRLTKPVEVS